MDPSSSSGDSDISMIRRGFESMEYNSEKLKLDLFESQQKNVRYKHKVRDLMAQISMYESTTNALTTKLKEQHIEIINLRADQQQNALFTKKTTMAASQNHNDIDREKYNTLATHYSNALSRCQRLEQKIKSLEEEKDATLGSTLTEGHHMKQKIHNLLVQQHQLKQKLADSESTAKERLRKYKKRMLLYRKQIDSLKAGQATNFVPSDEAFPSTAESELKSTQEKLRLTLERVTKLTEKYTSLDVAYKKALHAKSECSTKCDLLEAENAALKRLGDQLNEYVSSSDHSKSQLMSQLAEMKSKASQQEAFIRSFLSNVPLYASSSS